MQLRVLGSGLFQDWNVRVGVFAEIEEVLIFSVGFGSVNLHGIVEQVSWVPAWNSAVGSHSDSSVPSIEFTKIPPAAQGRRERVDTIAGRVKNSRPGQQIVINAQSGQWWVQRWPPYLGS